MQNNHSAAYKTARLLYLPFKYIFRPLAKFPRLRNFGIAQREAFKQLFRQPGAIETKTDEAVLPHSCEKDMIPQWLVDEMQALKLIEPKIFPKRKPVQAATAETAMESKLAGPYLDLANRYGSGVSHVYLVPWLKTGGADLTALNYVRAVNDMVDTELVVIATGLTDSPWAAKLPDNVRFIDLGNLYTDLSFDEKMKLLLLLFIQQAPQVIHNLNSDLGYAAFSRHGGLLCRASRLYASIFCFDYTEEGERVGYSVYYIPQCYEYLDAVFSDNEAHTKELMDLFGFAENKFIVHYQPGPATASTPDVSAEHQEKLDILWAGRIDRQKRPDLLLEIAKRTEEMPLVYHVYGSSVLDRDTYSEQIASSENIQFHGPFDGLTSLNADDFDMYLYTSQWDGLPNILSEAIAMGLPVMASDVGGISELIKSGETGLLISPYDDVDAYVKGLKQLFASPSFRSDLAKNAQKLMLSRHSQESFRHEIEKLPNYLGSGM